VEKIFCHFEFDELKVNEEKLAVSGVGR